MGARPGTTFGDPGVFGGVQARFSGILQEYPERHPPNAWIDKSAICGILYTGRLYLDPKRQTPGNRGAQSHASFVGYKERQTAEELGYARFDDPGQSCPVFFMFCGGMPRIEE